MTHELIRMIKDAIYEITEQKHIDGHKFRCNCGCGKKVINLIGGRRTWTRVQFECGEIIKINCNCLKETK